MRLFRIIFCTAVLSILTLFYAPVLFAQEAVPGELIVKYKNGQTPDDINQDVQRRVVTKRIPIIGGLTTAIEDLNYKRIGEKTPEDKLKDITDANKKVDAVEIKKIFKGSVLTPNEKLDNLHILKAKKQDVKELEKIYKNIPEVEYAQPNYIAKATGGPITPNDLLYSQMWNLPKIQMPLAWNITQGSTSITVAVVDTGIDYNHPDFAGQTIVKGQDFYNNDSDPFDDMGHGTHVAGIIGAASNNNLGITGINWHAKILAVKVLNSAGAGTTSTIIAGIRYAADNGARVINLSLGGSSSCVNTQSVRDAVAYANQKGASVVVAAGNNNSDAAFFWPASCPGVIAVGATDQVDQRASFSNWGTPVSIAAPGVGIESTYPGGRYQLLDGTSMSTPHVSAAISLMLTLNPNLTPSQILSILKSTGDSISTDKPIGGVRLNVNRALLAVASTPITPSSTPSPTAGPTSPPTATPTSSPVTGDINHDGVINLLDFNIWRCEFLGHGVCANPPSRLSADLNHDSVVDFKDFLIWRNLFRP